MERKTMAKVNTVNVIEFIDNTVAQVQSFTDDTDGNIQAEGFFSDCIRENNDDRELEPDDFSGALDDGSWSDDNGYEIFIVHSS
jgi:hypothetical protein